MTVSINQPCILVECPELISSVRVGVLETLWYLEKQDLCKVLFKCTKEITKHDLLWCDVLVCVRGSEYVTQNIVNAARNIDRFVIYFLDDDLLNVPQNLSCSQYFNDISTKQNIIDILKMSNLLWTVNPYIAEKYSLYCPEYYIGRVPINLENIDVNNRTLDSVIRFLYAGSTDHEHLIQKYLKPAILKLCEEYEDLIEFTFIGANPHIKDNKQVSFFPYFDDYDEYKSFVRSHDYHYGFAIVLEDDFYKGKYYNKYLEYGSVGVIGIYSNVEPYTFIIRDGENGYYVEENSIIGWYNAIKRAIIEHSNYECIRKQIENEIVESFSHHTIAEDIKKAVPQLSEYKAPEYKKSAVRLLSSNYGFYYSRICFLFKQYKIIAIPIIAQKTIKKITKHVCRFLKGFYNV